MLVLGCFQCYTGIGAAVPSIGETMRTVCNLILTALVFVVTMCFVVLVRRPKGFQNKLMLSHEEL